MLIFTKYGGDIGYSAHPFGKNAIRYALKTKHAQWRYFLSERCVLYRQRTSLSPSNTGDDRRFDRKLYYIHEN
jgi:hypothetical protein